MKKPPQKILWSGLQYVKKQTDKSKSMKVAIWATSSLEVEYEAVSKEVFSISRAIKGSWIFSVSPHLVFKLSWKDKYLAFNPHFYLLLRILFPLIEKRFDINLVYGDMSPWIFHKSLTKNPIVHTITQANDHPVMEFIERCEKIIVQSSKTQDQLLTLGVPSPKIEIYYPGIDLNNFQPCEKRHDGSTKILFATAPRTREEMEARGCYLLIEAAKQTNNISYRFLYRTWRTGYTSLAATKKAIMDAGVKNIELSDSIVAEMHKIYPQHDYTIIPYTEENGGKECPNSVLEGLACGVPVLISSKCPFSKFIESNNCGVVFEPNVDDLIYAIELAKKKAGALSQASREVSEEYFNFSNTISKYEALLAGIMNKN